MNKQTILFITLILLATTLLTVSTVNAKPYHSIYKKTVKTIQKNHDGLIPPGEIQDITYSDYEEAMVYTTNYWRVFIYVNNDNVKANIVYKDYYVSWEGYYEHGKIFETYYKKTPGDE